MSTNLLNWFKGLLGIPLENKTKQTHQLQQPPHAPLCFMQLLDLPTPCCVSCNSMVPRKAPPKIVASVKGSLKIQYFWKGVFLCYWMAWGETGFHTVWWHKKLIYWTVGKRRHREIDCCLGRSREVNILSGKGLKEGSSLHHWWREWRWKGQCMRGKLEYGLWTGSISNMWKFVRNTSAHVPPSLTDSQGGFSCTLKLENH